MPPFLVKGAFFALFAKTTEKPQKTTKIISIDNQLVTKKVHFLVHFFAKIFGHVKNLYYLCIRFRSKMEHFQTSLSKNVIFERLSIHNKM